MPIALRRKTFPLHSSGAICSPSKALFRNDARPIFADAALALPESEQGSPRRNGMHFASCFQPHFATRQFSLPFFKGLVAQLDWNEEPS
jgi:hypothetical protein